MAFTNDTVLSIIFLAIVSVSAILKKNYPLLPHQQGDLQFQFA